MAKKGTPGDDRALLDFLADIMDDSGREFITDRQGFADWFAEKLGWNSGGGSGAQQDWAERTQDAIDRKEESERISAREVETRSGEIRSEYRISGRFASAAQYFARLFGR